MPKRLPPLNALRAFEAAARHLSFKMAAEELHVTPAAVGHQVRALEQYIGRPLFHRLNRELILTDAGRACVPELQQGFGKLASAVERLANHGDRTLLVVSVAPTLAVKWLVPRLVRFQADHPDISVRIESTMAVAHLAREGIDVGIRFCAGVEPGLRGKKLLDEEIAPVCAPDLLKGPHALRGPGDLRHHTLIHLEGESSDPARPDWAAWARAAGIADIDAERGPRFTQTVVAAQAAMDGQGVALLGQACLLDDLAAGRLVRPFDLTIPSSYGFWVVAPEKLFDQPRVTVFRDWLVTEAAESMRAVIALGRAYDPSG